MKNITRIINKLGEPMSRGRQGEYHRLDDSWGIKLYYSDSITRKDFDKSHILASIKDYYNGLLIASKYGFSPTPDSWGVVSVNRYSEFGKRCIQNKHFILAKRYGEQWTSFPYIWTGYIIMEHIENAQRLSNIVDKTIQKGVLLKQLVNEFQQKTGFAHRDPRAENVLVNECNKKRKYWIIDF